MVSRAELTRMGRMGFSDEDYAEWLKRTIARRKDIQAHETALAKIGEAGAMEREVLREAGLGERLGVTEAGLGERKRAEFEFERPEQVARVGLYGAQAGELTARAGTYGPQAGLLGAQAEEARAGTKLSGESLDYLKAIRGYRQERESQEAERAGLLTNIYRRGAGEGFDLDSLLEELPGLKKKRPLGKSIYEDYLLSY